MISEAEQRTVAGPDTLTEAVESQLQEGGRSPWLNGKLIAGLSLLLFVIAVALVGQIVWDDELSFVASSPLNLPPVGFTYRGVEGSWEHPLGTENSGRDLLAIIIVGVPYTLGVGFVAATIGVFLGVLLGFSAGYLGDRTDDFIRLATDITVTIPGLLVLILIQSLLQSINFLTMALLLSIFSWQGATRVFRAQMLSLRKAGYVKLARLSGSSTFAIMFREIMPNLAPYFVSTLTLSISFAIVTLVGIEVLGLGIQRVPSLGITLNNAINAAAILRGMWWWWGIPALILVLIFMGFLLISIGTDEVANPRLRNS